MSSYPLVILALVGAYIAYSYFARQKSLANANATFAHMGARDVASRLGLEVVEGNPELNLMMLHHAHGTSDMDSRAKGGLLGADVSGKSHGVTLRGQPNGRGQSFHYSLESELERQNLVGGGTLTRTLRFALSTEVRAPFPDFEVVLRSPNAALKPKLVFALPAQPTGVAAVDSALVVYTGDPRIAQLLGPLLGPLVGHTFVHLVGRDRRLELLADHATSSYATYFLEDNAKLHHAVADAIERFAGG